MAFGNGHSTNWWEHLIPGWRHVAAVKTIADTNKNVTNFKNGMKTEYGSSPTYVSGYGSEIFGASKIQPSDLGAWFKKYAAQNGINQNTLNMINSMSDAALGGILDEYWKKEGMGVWKNNIFDTSSAMQDLRALDSLDIPMEKSYGDILRESEAKIDAENRQIMDLYDAALNNQQSLYNSQMGNIDRGYNRYAKQLLAMDYQKNNQLLGNLEGSMSKARQNALEAGASAGVRLANNVNTLMSTQNQQAQQSLQTSNNLAQMLMNQQQAAAGLKGNLANAYSTNANNKAGLLQGTLERKQNYVDSSWNQYQNEYNDKLNAATAALGSNPFVDAQKGYNQTQNYKKQSQTQASPY